MNPIIKVNGISKRYKIGQIQGYKTIRESISNYLSLRTRSVGQAPRLSRNQGRGNPNSDYIWALKDVSFEVQPGEVIGIIGRNGSGKSTLLKILTRITEPTEGTAELEGRVSSLLEVGTGFHPELTGRENIYLNGALLGMRKVEIDKKFDEIVAFSEVEKFIDTPVKRYSSGMYVRLAFSVAAHLDPEILLVDEVLAVGDAAFQKKCLGKMGAVAKEGRTILFVSHNMGAVQNLCSHGVVLKDGKIAFSGSSNDSVSFYNNNIVSSLVRINLIDRKDRTGSGKLIFTGISYFDENNQEILSPVCGQLLKIKLHYSGNPSLKNVAVAVGFNSAAGEHAILLSSDLLNFYYQNIKEKGYFECTVKKFPLSPGKYFLNLFAQNSTGILDWIREADLIEVAHGDYFNIGKSANPSYQTVLVEHYWK